MAKDWNSPTMQAMANVQEDRTKLWNLKATWHQHISKIGAKVSGAYPDFTLTRVYLPTGTPLDKEDFPNIELVILHMPEIALDYQGLAGERLSVRYPLPEYLQKLRTEE